MAAELSIVTSGTVSSRQGDRPHRPASARHGTKTKDDDTRSLEEDLRRPRARARPGHFGGGLRPSGPLDDQIDSRRNELDDKRQKRQRSPEVTAEDIAEVVTRDRHPGLPAHHRGATAPIAVGATAPRPHRRTGRGGICDRRRVRARARDSAIRVGRSVASSSSVRPASARPSSPAHSPRRCSVAKILVRST